MRRAALLLFFSCAVLGAGCRRPDAEGTTRLRGMPHTDCEGCHVADLRAAIDPPHEGVLPTTCFVCHSQAAWSPTITDHEWTLDGAHAAAECFACHVPHEAPADLRAQLGGHASVPEPQFAGTSTECVSCHRDDFDRAVSTRPWHAQVGTECHTCHTTAAWLPATEPPPPPDAGPRDAGVDPFGGLDGIDSISSGSHRSHGPGAIGSDGDIGLDQLLEPVVDAGTPRRRHHHPPRVPPHDPVDTPPDTTPPHEDPPEEVIVPDVQSSASR